MDLMKYLLGNEGGLLQRAKEAMPIKPDGTLPMRPIDRMYAAAEEQGFDPRAGATRHNMGLDPSINIPLHVRMQHAGVPYSSWPDKAKQELTPEARERYEQALDPKMFAGPTTSAVRESARNALLNSSANQAASTPNPSLQALLGSSENTRNRMGGNLPATMNPAPRDVAPTVTAQQSDAAYNNKYQEIRMLVATGQLTEAEAAAKFKREFIDRQPQNKRGNPFG